MRFQALVVAAALWSAAALQSEAFSFSGGITAKIARAAGLGEDSQEDSAQEQHGYAEGEGHKDHEDRESEELTLHPNENEDDHGEAYVEHLSHGVKQGNDLEQDDSKAKHSAPQNEYGEKDSSFGASNAAHHGEENSENLPTKSLDAAQDGSETKPEHAAPVLHGEEEFAREGGDDRDGDDVKSKSEESIHVKHHSTLKSLILKDEIQYDGEWSLMDKTTALLITLCVTVFLVARRNARFKYLSDRVLNWIGFRFAKKWPKLPRWANSALGPASPREGTELTMKSKPTEIDTEHGESLRALKLMGLRGEYIPKRKGCPLNFRSIVSDQCMVNLTRQLPQRFSSKDWLLLYASELHGYSLLTAYQHAQAAGPFMIMVMDRNRTVFGAFCNESLQMGPREYYGTGETLIFQLEPHFRVHRWSCANEQFITSTRDMIAFGGGGKFALWLDQWFEHGTSESGSTTFEPYECLASSERFKCCAVEIWGFTLPSTTSSPKRGQAAAASFRKTMGFKV